MKNILTTIFVIWSITAYADYSGHYISFVIETHSGESITGHNYLPQIFLRDQSQSYQTYLEEHYELFMKNQFNDGYGNYTYHKALFEYSYTDISEEHVTYYALIEKTSISQERIKSVRITNMILFTYATQVSTKLQLDDLKWLRKNATDMSYVPGHYCEHEIHVFKNTKRIENLLQELFKTKDYYSKKLHGLESDSQQSNGEEYYRIQEEIETLNLELDEQLNEIIKKLNKEEHLIIFTTCTC